MRTRTLALTALLATFTAGSLLAQAPPPPPPAPQPGQAPRGRGTTPPAEPRTLTPPAGAPTPLATPERPRREGQPINVKVDLTLTDQRGGAQAIKRTVTVLAADGYTGSIRTNSQVYDPVSVLTVPLNVDATPSIVADD